MRPLLVSACLLLSPWVIWAQERPASSRMPGGWAWTADANVFVGVNHQQRRFRDFTAVESQNWLMATGTRRAGRGALTLSAMISLEPLTVGDPGSPQVFQTGETFRGVPLIDYQHPHDLIMGLEAEYRRPVGRATLLAAAGLVGAPSIGPGAFMHRPSARENPQAPLSHHHMDATHITPGVVRGGVEAGAWRAEASWFRGREPDEDRLDLDLGALDSVAGRLSWSRGAWSAQVSAAQITEPEALAPGDVRRLSASVSFAADGPEPRVAWLAAFGQNREVHGIRDAYITEATVRLRPGAAMYMRAEWVVKDILDAGFHPVDAVHPHRESRIGALTLGYVHDILQTRAGGVGIGGDLTTYAVPANLAESYGSPRSFHLFLRYRAPRAAEGPPAHVH